MSKELIDSLRDAASETECPNQSLEAKAADLIEAQQRELRVKDLTIGQMANDMQAAQNEIEGLKAALDSSFSKWGGYAAAKKRIEVAIEAMEHAEDYLRNCANSPVEADRLKDAIRAMGSE